MMAAVEQILRRYGQAVTVRRRLSGETVSGRAFLQPIRRLHQDAPVSATPLGGVCQALWLYLGTEGVAPGDTVEQDGRRFTVQEARRIYWRDQVLYCRAVLRTKKEASA